MLEEMNVGITELHCAEEEPEEGAFGLPSSEDLIIRDDDVAVRNAALSVDKSAIDVDFFRLPIRTESLGKWGRSHSCRSALHSQKTT